MGLGGFLDEGVLKVVVNERVNVVCMQELCNSRKVHCSSETANFLAFFFQVVRSRRVPFVGSNKLTSISETQLFSEIAV